MRRFKSNDAYARHNGTAPLPVWSGNRECRVTWTHDRSHRPCERKLSADVDLEAAVVLDRKGSRRVSAFVTGVQRTERQEAPHVVLDIVIGAAVLSLVGLGVGAIVDAAGRAAHWRLILPGAVVVYALVGALWHPLLGGQEYGCYEGPWVAVFVGAVVVGFGLLVSGLVLLIARKAPLEGWTAFAGILTIAAGSIVFEVAAANDYNVCSS